MINELTALENQVAEVVSLCRGLRSENALLRQQLASAEAEKRHLAERMEAARARLDLLAEQLPEADTSL